MPPSTGWICSGCRYQSRLIKLRPTYLQGCRSFVSLQDVSADKRTHNHEGEPIEDGRKPRKGAGSGVSTSANSLAQDVTPDAFLEKLFRSTGREPPAGPFLLRYSQRLSQVSKGGSAQDIRSQEESGEENVDQSVQENGPERLAKTPQRSQGNSRAEQSNDEGSMTRSTRQANSHFDTAGARKATHIKAIPNAQDRELFTDKHNVLDADLLNLSNTSRSGPHKRRNSSRSIQTPRTSFTSDHAKLQKLWRSYNSEMYKGDSQNKEKVSITLSKLLQKFADSNDHKHAIDVWRLIQAHKLSPSLKQWSMMLELARRKRDMASVDTIWRGMSAAGFFPDKAAWTTYISAVGRMRPHRLTQTLADLESFWEYVRQNPDFMTTEISAEDRGNYVPSVAPYNAAIECVIFKENDVRLREILSRMDRSGIQPDINTLNTLLKRAVATDGSEEAQQILHEMKIRGIEPDKVTITTLVGERLKRIEDDNNSESVTSTIKAIFGELDAQGFKPAPHTYTTALSVLLSGEHRHTAAAEAVMEHMREHGIESTHAYTVMISHYFTSVPPNRTAVDGLFARAKTGDIPVEWTFFDRVIEGYAWLKETDRMLDCLRYLPKIGGTPGWFALWRALQLLSEMQYYEVCDEIVHDVERKGGIGTYGVKTQMNGEPYFWDLVAELRSRGLISPPVAGSQISRLAEIRKVSEGDLLTSNSIKEEDSMPLNASMTLGLSSTRKASALRDHQGWGTRSS